MALWTSARPYGLGWIQYNGRLWTSQSIPTSFLIGKRGLTISASLHLAPRPALPHPDSQPSPSVRRLLPKWSLNPSFLSICSPLLYIVPDFKSILD